MPMLYRAFVSYSHADKEFGRWLHNRLESYRFPKQSVGRATERGAVTVRLGRLFRDEAEAGAADNLAAIIENALDNAQDMIVICSPKSARSPWVDKEIRYFKAKRPDGQVFAVILDGVPNSNDPETECFPPALKYAVGADLELRTDHREEPLAANAAADGREDAALRLLAGLSGLTFNDLRDREAQRVRAQRRRAALTMAAALVLIGLAGVGLTLAGMQTWANEINRSKVLAAQAERALDEHETDRAMLLLLAASPARHGHFGPGFADFPDTEALLARAAFEYRLERDVQFEQRFTGLLQWRGDTLTAVQGDQEGGFGGSNIRWREVGGAATQNWSFPQESPPLVAIGRSGGPLAFANETLQLYDPRSGRTGAATPLGDFAADLTTSEDGRFVAVLTASNRLLASSVNADLSAEKYFDQPLEDSARHIVLAPDGAYALALSAFESRCIPLRGGRRFPTRTITEGEGAFNGAAFAPIAYESQHGPLFALVREPSLTSSSGTVVLRSCSGDEFGSFALPNGMPRNLMLQFSHTGEALVGVNDGGAYVWDVRGATTGFGGVADPPLLAAFAGLGAFDDPESVAISPDGSRLAALDELGRLRVWNISNGELLGHVPNPNLFNMEAASNGDVFLMESYLGLWRLSRGAQPRRVGAFPDCSASVCSLSGNAPFADRIVVARNDGWAGVIDAGSGRVTTFVGAQGRPAAAGVTESGAAALFFQISPSNLNRRLSLWNVTSGARIGSESVEFDFRPETISPDGRLVAGIGYENGQALLILADAASGRRLAVAPARASAAAAPRGGPRMRPIAFVENGAQIIGWFEGENFRFAVQRNGDAYRLERIPEPRVTLGSQPWSVSGAAIDPITGRAITPDYSGPQQLRQTMLSPDARTLFVLEDGRSVRAYDLPPRGRELIEYACGRLSPDRTAFTDEEIAANPLLRASDRGPCERGGLLSFRWWLSQFGARENSEH